MYPPYKNAYKRLFWLNIKALKGEKMKGFTLIELLVVVLIIGILAAVALPQYEKAVLKSRLTQNIIRVKALHQAAQTYYMANGTYPLDVRDLDIDITAGATAFKKTSISVDPSHIGVYFKDGSTCAVTSSGAACSDKGNFYLVQLYKEQTLWARCDTPTAVAVCKSMSNGKSHQGTTDNHTYYDIL